jgi:hypothetical protein
MPSRGLSISVVFAGSEQRMADRAAPETDATHFLSPKFGGSLESRFNGLGPRKNWLVFVDAEPTGQFLVHSSAILTMTL